MMLLYNIYCPKSKLKAYVHCILDFNVVGDIYSCFFLLTAIKLIFNVCYMVSTKILVKISFLSRMNCYLKKTDSHTAIITYSIPHHWYCGLLVLQITMWIIWELILFTAAFSNTHFCSGGRLLLTLLLIMIVRSKYMSHIGKEVYAVVTVFVQVNGNDITNGGKAIIIACVRVGKMCEAKVDFYKRVTKRIVLLVIQKYLLI